MPSHVELRTSVSERWRPERDRGGGRGGGGGGGGGRGLTLLQVEKKKGGEERTREHTERQEGEERKWQDFSWRRPPSLQNSRGERLLVTYRCARSQARTNTNTNTNTVSAVTEACINNVAERNRMQILPYIRVYRGLAGSEQPLSFSALPSGWMHTRFPKLINHHICHPNNFSRWVCCNKGKRVKAKAIFNFSLYWLWVICFTLWGAPPLVLN